MSDVLTPTEVSSPALQIPEDVLPMIPRTAMPQVEEIYYPDLFVWLGDQGVTFAAGHCDPAICKVHQIIDFKKALAMHADVLLKPVLLSRDTCVLDGDHRWYRHKHDNTPMPYIQIDLEFAEAIKRLKLYPKVYEAAS